MASMGNPEGLPAHDDPTKDGPSGTVHGEGSLAPDAVAEEANPEATDPLIGTTLAGRFAIHRLLGQGGMGAVYEASSEAWGACAVKTLRTDGSATSREQVRRFLREARATLAIQSEHVVRVFEIDLDAKEQPFLAMQLLQGRDLSKQLREHGSVEPAAAAALFLQACRGLQAAHKLGIAHRDVKPANLFLHEEDGVLSLKVCDFGIAKRLTAASQGDVTTDLTHTGGLVGSPAYMSPEQAQNSKETDFRTDIWSLAVALHETLSGQRLWPDSQNLGALLVAICTRDAVPLLQRAPWVPEGLAAAVDRGLRRDPALRHASMEAFAAALEPFAAAGPLSWASLVPSEPRTSMSVALPPPASFLGATTTSSLSLAAGTTAVSPSSVSSPHAATPSLQPMSSATTGASSTAKGHPSTRRRWPLLAGLGAAALLVGALAFRPSSSSTAPSSGAGAGSPVHGKADPSAGSSPAGAAVSSGSSETPDVGAGGGTMASPGASADAGAPETSGGGMSAGASGARPGAAPGKEAPRASGVASSAAMAGSARSPGPGGATAPRVPATPVATTPATAAPAVTKKPTAKDDWQ
jgi:serine/threonine protein kinase